MVVESWRARRVDVRRHDQAGAREGRTGRREREDRYREKAAHLSKGYGSPLRQMVSGAPRQCSAGALATEADDRGVRQVGAETVLSAKPLRERLEDLHRDVLFGAALSAHQVAVLR